MKIKHIYIALLLLCGMVLSAAGYTWEIKQTPADGLLKKSGKFSCSVIVKQDSKVLVGKKIKVTYINSLGAQVKSEKALSGNPYVVSGTAERSPDWFQLEFSLLDDKGRVIRQIVNKKKVLVQKRVGFMVDKEKFTQTLPEPADYDEFWKNVKAELNKVPFDVTAETLPVRVRNNVKVTLKDIKVKCTGGIPVSGYLAVPENAKPKSLPAVVSFHGAGVHSASAAGVVRWASMGAIAFDMNAHGIINGKDAAYYLNLRKTVYYCPQPDGSPRYALRYIKDPQKYYFRGMYQRVMRALEFVKRQPQWNGKDLIVIGGSQGGAQVFAAAGLDPQVSMLVAAVPAFSEFGGAVSKVPHMGGWPLNTSKNAELSRDPAALKCTAYFDNANFAKRIRIPAYVSAGLCDVICPPGGIAAVFANLKSKEKSLQIYPQGQHGSSPCSKGYQALQKLLSGKK
ncbi:MAG: acetylxylan esterase [Lentisphaeria bacterium]|nr:acetylxylan esterase [Lentisphaeria bacterium]